MSFNMRAVTQLHLSPIAMQELLRAPNSPVVRDLIVRATRVQTAASHQIKIGHVHAGPTNYQGGVGNLRNSLRKRVVPAVGKGSPSVLVGSDHPIALIYHQGAKPHIIKPRRAKVLVFWMNGQKVVTKRVNHPGTKPNRYLTDNLKYAII